MKFLVLISTWILSFSALAEDSSVTALARLLGATEHHLTAIQCSMEDPHQQCLVDVCGSPRQSVRRQENINDEAFRADPEIQKELDKISKRLTDVLTKRLELNRATAESISAPGSFDQFTPRAWNEISHQMFSPFIQTYIDYSKPFPDRVKRTIIPPLNATPSFLKALTEYEENQRKIVMSSTFEMIASDYFPPEESKKLLELEVEKMSKRTDLDERQKEKLIAIEKDLVQKFYSSASYSLQQIHKELGKNEEEQDYCLESCEAEIKSRDFYGEFQRAASEKAYIEKSVNECLTRFALPLYEQRAFEAFKNQMPRMLDTFIERGMKGLSQHSKTAFRNYFDSLEKKLNGSQNFMNDLKNEEDYKSAFTMPDSPQEFIFRFLNKDNAIDPLKNVWFCNENERHTVTDAVSEDELMISVLSSMHPETGERIFYHELGHVLKNAFAAGVMSEESLTYYQARRQCVTALSPDRQTGAYPDNFMGTVDSGFSEEDFADYLSYETSAGENDPVNACSFFDTSPDAERYLTTPLTEDLGATTHSPSLLRLLREIVFTKRSIPSSCQKVMDENSERYRFTPCP